MAMSLWSQQERGGTYITVSFVKINNFYCYTCLEIFIEYLSYLLYGVFIMSRNFLAFWFPKYHHFSIMHCLVQICHIAITILLQITKGNWHMKLNQFKQKFYSSFLHTAIVYEVFVDKQKWIFLNFFKYCFLHLKTTSQSKDSWLYMKKLFQNVQKSMFLFFISGLRTASNLQCWKMWSDVGVWITLSSSCEGLLLGFDPLLSQEFL